MQSHALVHLLEASQERPSKVKGADTLAEKVSKPLRRRPRERELRGCGCNGVNTLDAGQSEHQQQNNECFFGAFGKQPRANAQQCPSEKHQEL